MGAYGCKLARFAGPCRQSRSLRNRQGLHCAVKGNIFGHQLESKRKNPAKAGFHSGQRRLQSLWPRSRGISAFRCGERDLVSQFCRENSRLSSFQPPPTPLPDAWNQDALGPGSNSCRSRGSLHGSRYSRLGATRKGEKAMAGQRKNPTTGAVTVLKPTDRQTPKRAGSAEVTHSRKSGTPVGSGSRVAAPGTISPLRGVMRDAFFKSRS